MESICWTCARAYARPDPEGCGFHRTSNHIKDLYQNKYITEARLRVRSKPTASTEEKYEVIIVTKCRHYNRENRKADRQIAAMEAWERGESGTDWRG